MKTIIAATCLLSLMTCRKIYTHFYLFEPAHEAFQKAHKRGDLAAEDFFLAQEYKYMAYGLDPIWFLDGREKP